MPERRGIMCVSENVWCWEVEGKTSDKKKQKTKQNKTKQNKTKQKQKQKQKPPQKTNNLVDKLK